MPSLLPVPTLEDVDRIRALPDPVIRNLQITQCYHELSAVLARSTGVEANWCTFAAWASKQAGQTIRKEDLARLFEQRLRRSPATLAASREVAKSLNAQGEQQLMAVQAAGLRAENLKPAIDRAGDAVARGNRKVFEEIGAAFARFFSDCFPAGQFDLQAVPAFCDGLAAGDPPGGQSYLRQAFAHYGQALSVADPKTRAELMLLANLEIGFHEQTRLQPEIAESLDAGYIGFMEFARALFRDLFPARGWFHLAHLYLMRLLGRPTALDRALQALLAEMRAQLRQLITETMMTLALPSGVLRLGDDLSAAFPAALQNLTHPGLCAFLDQHDLTPDSLTGSGALDWADLPDRLHFIIDLFRCYQQHLDLFDPPFTPGQVAALKAGRLPDGRL